MKIISTSVLILAAILALVSVNCLTIQHNKQVEHFAEALQESISHQLCDALHLKKDGKDDKKPQNAQSKIEQQLQTQLMGFIFGDAELLGEIMAGGAISQKSVKKIKDFIVGNDKLVNMIFDQINKDLPKDNCLAKMNLTQDKKKKLVSVILDAMDLQKMLNQKQEKGKGKDNKDKDMSPEEKKKIYDAIAAEPALGPEVVKCIQEIEAVENQKKNNDKSAGKGGKGKGGKGK